MNSTAKRLCAVQLQQTAVGQQVHTNLVIAMCGIAKVFVGELVETGTCTEPLHASTMLSGFVGCRPEHRAWDWQALLPFKPMRYDHAAVARSLVDGLIAAACSPEPCRESGRRRASAAIALGGGVSGAGQGRPCAAPQRRQAIVAVTWRLGQQTGCMAAWGQRVCRLNEARPIPALRQMCCMLCCWVSAAHSWSLGSCLAFCT